MSELNELIKIDADSWHVIHQFLEYLSENKIWLAKYYGDDIWEQMHPISSQEIDKLVYGFFGTTPEKCEKERRQILEKLREKRRRT